MSENIICARRKKKTTWSWENFQTSNIFNIFIFQDSNSLYSDNLISFHNFIILFIIIIISLTLSFIIDFILNKYLNLILLKNHLIEIIWTLIPIFILLIICYPSLKILYFIDIKSLFFY